MEEVAEHRPQEARLRVFAGAQALELLRRILELQYLDHFRRGLGASRAILARLRIQHDDVLAALLEDAGAGLLAERALGDQPLQPLGRLEIAMPGILGQGVGHGLDHVGHGVQPDHVGGAVGRRLRPTQQRSGEGIDFVETQAEGLGVVQRGQDREHADPVADEVRRVLGVHDALAQGGDQEAFQPGQHLGVGGGAGNQLGQVHVARRVEEVDAAETVVKRFIKNIRQAIDRQAGSVRREEGIRADEGQDPGVQVLLPVQALGDGLDDQVAVAQQVEVLVVVGRDDGGRTILGRQRRRRELAQVGDGLEHDAVAIALLGGKVEQDRLDTGVDEVGGDLRAHHAGAEHGHLADSKG